MESGGLPLTCRKGGDAAGPRWPALLLASLSMMGCDAAPPTAPSPTVGYIGEQAVTEAALAEAFMARQGQMFFYQEAERRLVEAAAKEAGLAVSAEAAQGAARAEIESVAQGRFGGDLEALKAEIERQGWDFERWKAARVEAQRLRMLTEALIRRDLPEAELKALFEQRHGAGGITLKVGQILITTHLQSSGLYTRAQHEARQDALSREARRRAQLIRKRAEEGADFAALAQANSDDYTAAAGGWAGADWPGRYGPAFDALVERLSVGELSPVVEGPEGFHIVRVDGLRKGARYTGRYILIRDGAEGEAEARRRAAAVMKRLQGGADFAKVAVEVSEDAESQARGGDLGTFQPGRLGPQTDAILETLPIGELSGPIRVDGGFQIVKLSDRQFLPAEDMKLIRHILVATSYLRVKARLLRDSIDEKAREKAMSLMKRLAEGEITFEALAREASEDAHTGAGGGVIPRWRSGLLGPEVDANLAEMNPGQIRLVRSERGYHLIKLIERETVKMADVLEDLKATLRQRPLSDEQIRSFQRALREKAKVRWIGQAGAQSAEDQGLGDKRTIKD